MIYDITYCSKVDCINKSCFRNQCHIEDTEKLISISDNKDCDFWKEDELLKDLVREGGEVQ